MVTRMFKSQLGQNVKAYIDDMVVKSKLRLNASKCSFSVSFGKFLGYMITHRGIEVNLDQVRAINDLHPPRNPKEVQRLT